MNTINSELWADRRKPLDPSLFRWRKYVMNAECSTSVGGIGNGSIKLDNNPFVLDFITHGIFTLPDDVQDGNYSMQFREGQTVFNDFPAMSHTLFGSVYQGNEVVLPTIRQFFKGGATLIMDMTNYTNRTGVFPDGTFTLQVVFHGFEPRIAK